MQCEPRLPSPLRRKNPLCFFPSFLFSWIFIFIFLHFLAAVEGQSDDDDESLHVGEVN